MKNAHTAAYSILCVASLAMLLVFIPAYTPQSDEYGMHPALLPNCYAVIILGCSLLMLVREVLNKGKGTDKSPVDLRTAIRTGCVVAALFVYLPLVKLAGAVPAGAITLFLLQILMGQRSPLFLIGLSAALPWLLNWGMTAFLKIPLP